MQQQNVQNVQMKTHSVLYNEYSVEVQVTIATALMLQTNAAVS